MQKQKQCSRDAVFGNGPDLTLASKKQEKAVGCQKDEADYRKCSVEEVASDEREVKQNMKSRKRQVK